MQTPSEQTSPSPLQALTRDTVIAGDWILDPRTSSIRLKTKSMWGVLPVNGVFGEVSGNGTVWPNGKVTGIIKVASASIDTNNTRRDAHLRSADFLDSFNSPHITFTADDLRASSGGVTVTGALTVRGRTRPLCFDATASVSGEAQVCLDAEVCINRADFGLTRTMIGMASVHNTVTIHAVFSRQ